MKQTPVADRLSGKQKASLLIIFLIPIVLLEILDYFSNPKEILENPKLTIEIEIPRGAALTQIADSLYAKQLIDDKDLFVFWAKSLGYETKMRAGYFEVPAGLNDYNVVKYLSTAKISTKSITFLEGWDIEQYAREISSKYNLSDTIFLDLCYNRQFIKDLGLNVLSLEGYLLPNTYFFSKNEKPERIIKYLVDKTVQIFENDTVQQRISEMNMTVHEILTLASIVEGEALIDAERPIIASLYYNRLKKRMRLQADPTIQYAIAGPPRRLLNRDLEVDSPYNTYKYYGLPPGPINNPGKASIMATIFPDSTKYLYMVAVGDGSHAFSTSLKEHLKAKEEFDKVRRKVARERRLKGN